MKDWPGPVEGERPSAYIIILGDKNLSGSFGVDHGIAAQSMMLGATERGLGSDLAELRSMQEMASSDSALRHSGEDIRAQLRGNAAAVAATAACISSRSCARLLLQYSCQAPGRAGSNVGGAHAGSVSICSFVSAYRKSWVIG